jgi:hypothetical protein
MTKDQIIAAIDQRCNNAAFLVSVQRLGEILGRIETLVVNNAPAADQAYWIGTARQYIWDNIEDNS